MAQKTLEPAQIFLTDDNSFYGGGEVPVEPGQAPPTDNLTGHVEAYGDKGVDAVSFDFCGGQMLSYPTKAGDVHPGLAKQYVDAGIDAAEIVEQTCHRAGLQFWPAARMNASLVYRSKIHDEHPDWIMTQQNWWGYFRPMFNYEIPGVRQYMLNIFREMVERYDADGLLLNYARYSPLFYADRDLQCADLLTDYMGEIRAMLDEVGQAKGKRLGFAAQVLARPNDGRRFGHNVFDWISRGYFDYVMPTRANNCDPDMPIDAWVAAAKGTNCRVLPSLHTMCCYPWISENRNTHSTMRSAAHIYYGQGADGLSGMNIMSNSVEVSEGWFHELRDPAAVASGPHHYRYAMRANNSEEGNLAMLILNADTDADGNIIDGRWPNSITLRLVDEPSSFKSVKARLTITGGGPGNCLLLVLNGREVPEPARPNGQRGHEFDKTSTDNVYQVSVHIPTDLLTKGTNELAVGALNAIDAHGHDRPVNSMTLTEVELFTS